MPALTAALLDALPYATGTPARMLQKLVEVPVGESWREQLLAPDVDALSVSWGPHEVISRSAGAIGVDFPADLQPTPATVLEFHARLPLELAVLSSIQDHWAETDYYAPAIGADHALLGWGVVAKGAGHERSFVSRRWLEHGPFRTLQGPADSTLVQLHDLAADGPTSLEQAQPGHEWIVAGFLRSKHRFKHDIEGIYTKEDGLLRVVINDRPVTDDELRDACAARRDGREDPTRPIRNIAYVFVDEAPARARLEALWLRELECRVADGRGERRLDADHRPAIAKPGWV
jgi:hypothetical protein